MSKPSKPDVQTASNFDVAEQWYLDSNVINDDGLFESYLEHQLIVPSIDFLCQMFTLDVKTWYSKIVMSKPPKPDVQATLNSDVEAQICRFLYDFGMEHTQFIFKSINRV